MLSRRHLRIKVMQSLYAYFQDTDQDIVKSEKNLLLRVDRILDLYYYLLSLIMEIHHFSTLRMDDAKRKHLPTYQDLNPNTRFLQNRIFQLIAGNLEYNRELSNRKIRWHDQDGLIRKLFSQMKECEAYKRYMSLPDTSFNDDKNLILDLYNQLIFEHENLHFFLGEQSIYWGDDYEDAATMVIQTIKRFEENDTPAKELARLFKENYVKNVEEDKRFMIDLFRKTISDNAMYERMIGEKTKNWDVDRIAIMDVLLMKMALCELMEFETVPVKVTLNEYIEIAKSYSTPKSKVFINGVLDKIVVEMKREEKIHKTGRGLLE